MGSVVCVPLYLPDHVAEVTLVIGQGANQFGIAPGSACGLCRVVIIESNGSLYLRHLLVAFRRRQWQLFCQPQKAPDLR